MLEIFAPGHVVPRVRLFCSRGCLPFSLSDLSLITFCPSIDLQAPEQQIDEVVPLPSLRQPLRFVQQILSECLKNPRISPPGKLKNWFSTLPPGHPDILESVSFVNGLPLLESLSAIDYSFIHWFIHLSTS